MEMILSLFLTLILLFSYCLAGCEEEKTSNGVFVWSKCFSNTEKTSKPICLDINNFPVTRKCADNDSWIPSMENVESRCVSKQEDNLEDTFCPQKYSRVPKTNLCILISAESQKWSQLCLNSTEVLPAYLQSNIGTSIKKILRDKAKGGKKYWLPIRRDNRLGYVRYKIVTHYNVKFNESLISEPIGGNCLSLTYSQPEWKFILANCEDFYSMVCLIDIVKFYKFSKFHCSKLDSYTTFNPRYHDHCYRLLPFNNDQPLKYPLIINSEELQYLANAFLEIGNNSNKNIQIDIMPDEETRVRMFNRTNWINGREKIRFTNWGANFLQSWIADSERYTILRNGAWRLLPRNNSLIEYAIQDDQIKPTTDPDYSGFQFDNATSYEQNFFIHSCFSNDNIMSSANMMLDIGRTYFRCEGFTMKTLKLIKSPTIETWSKETLSYEIFVIIMDKKCTKCDFIHESRSIEDDITSLTMENQIIQFRKIIDIDIKSNITTFLLHLLAKKSLLKSIYQNLSKQLQGWPYNVIHLRHIDTCLGRSGNYFNFPDVLIGETSTNENCQYDNGDH